MQFLFAATILLSAALMFIVEPMFAKMVLPRLGGSPSVWNTCLVFYQGALMAGYIYAHLTLKWLGPRRQALLHVVLMCLPWVCGCLPIRIVEGWTPPTDGNPAGWLLLLLTARVGLPFIMISASAPVLQAWFSHSGGRNAKDPYFLYAASNLGSLGGLAAYPLWIEAHLTLQSQTGYWTASYMLLVALFVLCAAALWRASPKQGAGSHPEGTRQGAGVDPLLSNPLPIGFQAPVTLRRRLYWLALAIVPAALLMGVTTHLAVDMPSQPMLWAIPLGLYLISFIVVFARWPIVKWLWVIRIFQAAGLVAAAGTVYLSGLATEGILGVGALHLTAFFLTAIICHGMLAADRPASAHLTEYFLWMSAGGVLGGLACALVAPLVFSSVVEYPLMLVVACLLGPCWRWPSSSVVRASRMLPEAWTAAPQAVQSDPAGPSAARAASGDRRLRWLRRFEWAVMLLLGCVFAFAATALWHDRLKGAASNWEGGWPRNLVVGITEVNGKIGWVIAASILAFLLLRSRVRFTVAVMTLLAVSIICCYRKEVIYRTRSFFGVLCVETDYYSYEGDDADYVSHILMHGSTIHGKQSFDPEDLDSSYDPWTYYHRAGPVGDVFRTLEHREEFLRHGHIGVVGLGTGTIAAYAQEGQTLTYFEIDPAVREIAQNPEFFTYLTDCRVTPEIHMGDARLTLAGEPDGRFDLLLIDAFSSDAIPVHLLTFEAVQMYMQKLSPHGLLMVHLSNRHLNLAPVVARTAAELQVVARLRNDDDESFVGKFGSEWAVLARTPQSLQQLQKDKRWTPLEPKPDDPLWTDDFSSIVSVMNWDWLPKWMQR
jgi:hypothetical protein